MILDYQSFPHCTIVQGTGYNAAVDHSTDQPPTNEPETPPTSEQPPGPIADEQATAEPAPSTAEPQSVTVAATAPADEPTRRAVPGRVISKGTIYVPAGLWPRILAFVIDMLVLLLAHELMILLTGIQFPDIDTMMSTLTSAFEETMSSGLISTRTQAELNDLLLPWRFAGWLNVVMCAAYFTIFHGMLGASLGKLCLGLRVLRHDGSALGYGWAFIRYLAYFIVAKLAYTAWLVPFDAKRRTLYDMVLGTNVFKPVAVLEAATPES